MKCDTCEFQRIHIGAGPPGDYSMEYCYKGHWDGAPLFDDDNEEDQDDPWILCIDYKQQEIDNNQQ